MNGWPRPDPPEPGQESVWAYPRPAIAEPIAARLRVVFAGRTIADTVRGVRTLETSHPPSYYLPRDDIDPDVLVATDGGSLCEWKGRAIYLDVVAGERRAARAAWSYPSPTPSFAAIAGHVAFYAGMMDACFVDDDRVVPQPGGFYGGWITPGVAGPFKGVEGSAFW